MRLVCLTTGGLRDAVRDHFDAQYDKSTGVFLRRFRVGQNCNVCERAFGVAASIGEKTFVNAKLDSSRDRPRHAGRVLMKESRRSADSHALDAWIRAQRNSMEVDKKTGARWFFAKLTKKELWGRYTSACDRAGEATRGNSDLLWRLWQSHDEIRHTTPSGHDVCDFCFEKKSRRLELDGLTDAASTAERAQLDKELAEHEAFNRRERDVYDDAVYEASYHPVSTSLSCCCLACMPLRISHIYV